MATRRTFTTATNLLRKQASIPAAYYRGGTSRALIFNSGDLPVDRNDWAPIFLGTIGSPDPNGRQLDGLGGAISSLSKICVVKASQRPNIHVDFTFVQVGIRDSFMDYEGNCGNMTAAIGPFAVDSGLVRPSLDNSGENIYTVKLYNTNTRKTIHATFPVCDGEAVSTGSFAIDGVAGTGAKIRLDFIDPSGSKTGSLLPTGNVVDEFELSSRRVKATCIDAGNPCIFVPAEDVLSPPLASDGTILPNEMQNQPELLARLETIRREASIKMGIAKSPEHVPPSIPKICLVSSPTSHRLLSGECMDGSSVNVVVRTISTGQPHKALPITAGLAVSAAAKMDGTVVAECLRPSSEGDGAEIFAGHPSGRLAVEARYDEAGKLESSTVYRTARKLMDGKVYWKT